MAFTSHGYHVNGTTLDEPMPPMVARCGGPGPCSACSEEAAWLQRREGVLKDEPANPVEPAPPYDDHNEHLHDQMTIVKVYDILVQADMISDVAMECIKEMNKQGIVLRERLNP